MPNFIVITYRNFHRGKPLSPESRAADKRRFLVTADSADEAAFKVPMRRNRTVLSVTPITDDVTKLD